MPFGSEGTEDGVGLALSGGGFRATLFHAGTLLRLNELGVLPKLNRISSVSGGSITAGVLSLAWSKLAFDANGVATNIQDQVVTPLRKFCTRSIDAPAIGEGAFLPWRKISDIIIREYKEHLFGEATLQDLPEAPRFVFNATNMQTGVSFRFSKPYMGDYRIGLRKNPDNLVAQAVAASSAFPPVLSPVIVKAPGRFEAVQGSDLNGNHTFTDTLWLSDGGVYDNMGLETVWNRYKTVLVSDAGAPSDPVEEPETVWHKQVLAALDVATTQARSLRKRALIADFKAGVRKGSYWGLRTAIKDYPIQDAMPVDPQKALWVSKLRTRLNPFTELEQGRLINLGYALSDAALRSHCKEVVANATKPNWPLPGQALD
jgi:NTE family protein